MLLMITGFSNLCDPTNMTPPEGHIRTGWHSKIALSILQELTSRQKLVTFSFLDVTDKYPNISLNTVHVLHVI